MKFLFFGKDGNALSLAYRMSALEGEDVGYCILNPNDRDLLTNMGVERFGDMPTALRWAGRNSYLLADDEMDVTYLRSAGYKVYGGNTITAKMENDRVFQSKTAGDCGVPIPHFHQVKSVDEAIAFVKKHPDAWCLKQLGHAPKDWNFVGKEDDGRDVILQLEWIKQHPTFKKMGGAVPFMLQELVEGQEFACGAWWTGDDWLRNPDGSVVVGLNREHKKALQGDRGLACGEMGTVLQMGSGGKLFDMMLDPLTPFLSKNCRGVKIAIDANCGVVSADEAWLYEYTVRNGYPISSLYAYMLESGLAQFFADMLDGGQGNNEWKPGWCVGTEIGCGFFPNDPHGNKEMTWKNQPVEIDLGDYVMPECLKFDPKEQIYRIADACPCVAVVTHNDLEIAKANAECVADMEKIKVRAPVYRTDIGERFAKEELSKLQDWGFI